MEESREEERHERGREHGAVHILSLLLVALLLGRVLRERQQAQEDSFPVLPATLVTFFLAALFHADRNAHPISDTLWMAGLLVSVIAVLPQLWLIARTGGPCRGSDEPLHR